MFHLTFHTLTLTSPLPPLSALRLANLHPSQLYVYYTYGTISFSAQLVMMAILGFFSNGPYALITTAVSADLVSGIFWEI